MNSLLDLSFDVDAQDASLGHLSVSTRDEEERTGWLAEGRLRVAVLVPCHNEAASIAGVVRDFQRALPMAPIYVYDNRSTDGTRALAKAAGALVRQEGLAGKGHVVRRMFADVEADVYVLVDGDGTYDAASSRRMVEMLLDGQLDMVNGTRVTESDAAYRRGHRLGNKLMNGIVGGIFGNRVPDMMSGYRVFSRRFVKSFPAMTGGFQIETELTVHALALGLPMGQVETRYHPRRAGSCSKLRTYRDGLRILTTIIRLVKDERPLETFSAAAVALFLLGVGLSVPIVLEFERTHLVPRFPTAILSTGIVLVSMLSLACGLILDSVARARKEAKRMAYLSMPCVAYGTPYVPGGDEGDAA